MCRAFLYELSEARFVFLLVVHHIAIDGWSLWRVLDELQRAYDNPLALGPGPGGTYRDFVMKQRAFIRSPEGSQQLEHWRNTLRAPLPTLQLPCDQARPPQQSFRGDELMWHFNDEFVEAYRAGCREHGVTPFTMGMALYSVLLHRLSRQDDLLVSVPVAGRNADKFADVVGFFVNSLPVRINVDGSQAFHEHLSKVKRTLEDAREHEEIPFSVLVDELQVPRDASHPVLCQAMFVHQKIIAKENSIGFDDEFHPWGVLRAKHYPLKQQQGQFDFGLEFLEGESTLTAHWKFNSDLFQRETVHSIATAFERLAQQVLSVPTGKIEAVPLTSADQARSLLAAPKQRFSVDATLHARFRAAAKKHAKATAVKCGQDSLTYEQLDELSDRLCQHLLAQRRTSRRPRGGRGTAFE